MAKKEDIRERAKRCFKEAVEATQRQRKREIDDLRFQVPEFQWDEAAKRQRLGMAVDGVPTPARPILSIPKLDQPIQLVNNQMHSAHLGIKIQPLSPEADDEVAEILQGLYRSIERDSNAGLARGWAFDRTSKCGRGAYRVNTKYDDRGGHPFDQVITIDRILHQDQVYFDPAAHLADFSDGEWAIITTWVPLKTFKRLYPKATETTGALEDLAFQSEEEEAPDWVKGDGDSKAVLVAEFFYKIHEKVVIALLEDMSVMDKDQVPPGVAIVNEREDDRISVEWCKLTGFEVLEETTWNGKFIPIIPVVGRELQPFDGERRWVGIIGPAKDGQRLYNYAVSNAVEMAALEPKAPWIGAEGQFEGHESEWQQSNTRNFPYLQYKPTTIGDKPAPPPQRAQVDVGRLGPSMALIQQADSFLQATTATFDPSLGRTNQKERSGRAIMALQEQADAGNSNYLQNLAEISMPYEARVILDLIPRIYDRPGRLARTLDTEDDTEQVMLNVPFYTDPRTKRAVPVGPGGAPPQGIEVKNYDLRKGVYSVAVSVGRSRQTLTEEASEEIGQILQAAPQLMPLIGPIYFKFRDFPGAQEIAEMLAKLRDKQFPDLSGDEGTGVSPEQAQAQLQAMGQQLQLMQQQLAAAAKAIEGDQAKQQATLMKAQMDNEAKERIAAMEAQTRVLIEQIKAQGQAREAGADRSQEAQQDAAKISREREAEEFKAAHEVAMRGLEIGQQASQVPAPLEEPLDVR